MPVFQTCFSQRLDLLNFFAFGQILSQLLPLGMVLVQVSALNLRHRYEVVGEQFAIVSAGSLNLQQALVGHVVQLFPQGLELESLCVQHVAEGHLAVIVQLDHAFAQLWQQRFIAAPLVHVLDPEQSFLLVEKLLLLDPVFCLDHFTELEQLHVGISLLLVKLKVGSTVKLDKLARLGVVLLGCLHRFSQIMKQICVFLLFCALLDLCQLLVGCAQVAER
jgi:hypothetical protein